MDIGETQQAHSLGKVRCEEYSSVPGKEIRNKNPKVKRSG
jgi:hypothetical protein